MKLKTALLRCRDRLSAWRDNANLLVRRLPDGEAEPYRHLRENFDALVQEIDSALVGTD